MYPGPGGTVVVSVPPCDVTGHWDPSRPEPSVLPVLRVAQPSKDVTGERIRVGLSRVCHLYSESARADREVTGWPVTGGAGPVSSGVST